MVFLVDYLLDPAHTIHVEQEFYSLLAGLARIAMM